VDTQTLQNLEFKEKVKIVLTITEKFYKPIDRGGKKAYLKLSNGKILTLVEFARLIGYGDKTVYRYLSEGGITDSRLIKALNSKNGAKLGRQNKKEFNRTEVCIKKGEPCTNYMKCFNERFDNKEWEQPSDNCYTTDKEK
jgi:hypothetical protein